jgi:hypothetical protein
MEGIKRDEGILHTCTPAHLHTCPGPGSTTGRLRKLPARAEPAGRMTSLPTLKDVPMPEVIEVTKPELYEALLKWEQDARAGLCRTHQEAADMPAEDVATESAERLWAALTK